MPTPEQLRAALADVMDPDFDIGIVDMGLVYDLSVNGGHAKVVMTLTSPMCPHAGAHKQDVIDRLLAVDGVDDVEVEITFTPPWDPRTMASDNFKVIAGLW
jgi:metal-sulfur cluster biosynthetic enzyme